MAKARAKKINASLTILGDLCWKTNREACKKEAVLWCKSKNILKYVNLLGRYTQKQMPKIFSSHHILLHTKINDPCPTVVLEGLAAGLPIIYSNSGGTPELVGKQAGIGIQDRSSWLFEQSASPDQYTNALKKIIKNYKMFQQKSFKRRKKFSEITWIKFHKVLFSRLLVNNCSP